MSGHTEQTLLSDVSLDIEKGEFIAIVGRSGSGKSTLLNIIGCLDTDFSGQYVLDGEDVSTLSSDELANRRCNHFGFVFQRYHLLPTLNSLANVALPAIYAGRERDMRLDRALVLLDHLGLEDKQNSIPTNLSGGEQQRVSIARALMNEGDILLADEPTGALDSASSDTVMRILKRLHEEGKTLLLVTHDKEIASCADRMLEICDGRIVSDTRQAYQKHTQSLSMELPPYRRVPSPSHMVTEIVSMALQAVRAKVLRTTLTILSVVVGIAAVLFVMALGQGAQEKVIADMNQMGANSIEVYPGNDFGDTQEWRLNSLTIIDVDKLKSLDYIKGVSPVSALAGLAVKGSLSRDITLTGVDRSFFSIRNLTKEEGRFLTEQDSRNAASTVVISQAVKNVFFSDTKKVLGETILFNGIPLVVVGILRDDRLHSEMQNNLKAFVAYSTMQYRIVGSPRIESITIAIKKEYQSQVAEAAINTFLLRAHNGKKDFFTFNTNTLQKAVEQTTQTLTLFATCIAFISLLVGGIGVANIMLVSVTERVQEIGLRMAVGARRGDILQQLILESIIMCSGGACLGCGLAYLARFIFESSMPDIPLSYTYHGIIMAFVCSTALGTLAGCIPAYSASRLNPATALMNE
ncbi:ABC transporter permease [Desulfovibrio inopinatus]|uniref:ABC transporter permease n=1 Tax=Desulfovibrio inopinatus TaxID=102109 RepID=UPI001FE2318D|nr:ABC transporter permease [Desulfovibrio inopinatus]